MKLKLILALIISFVFIGGASVSRFAAAEKIPPYIAAVDRPSTLDTEEYNEIFLGESADLDSPSVSEPETLTNSDILGRQLILGYVDLATQGQATEENINTLANRYLDIVPNLNAAQTVSLYDIKISSDTNAGFRNYNDEMARVYTEYVRKLDGTKITNDVLAYEPDLYSSADNLSVIYTQTAQKLEDIATPPSLAYTHIKLINLYLANAAAMNAISKTEADPSSAFAGIITLKGTSEEEGAILEEIEGILAKRGL